MLQERLDKLNIKDVDLSRVVNPIIFNRMLRKSYSENVDTFQGDPKEFELLYRDLHKYLHKVENILAEA